MSGLQNICPNLTKGDDGIWYAPGEKEISYPAEANKQCFSIEDNSFWFRHRNNCIVSAVKTFPPDRNGFFIDIGGGNGFVSRALIDAGITTVLLEPGRTGALNAIKRGISDVICATVETAQIRKNSVAAIGLFDVLEHFKEDAAFLELMHSLLTPQGKLFITIPAYPFLWSDEDVYAGHFRRYTIKSISTIVEQAGFEILYSSYFFRFLPVPIFLFRTLPFRSGINKRIKTEEDITRVHSAPKGFISSLLNRMLSLEVSAIGRKKTLRFGGSCIIVATRGH
jgi:hypothetical protein